MALPIGRCPDCGFDPPTVSPSDAAVAARSYPRRYRALLVRPDDEDPEIVHRRPGPDEPSAAEHAGQAAAAMDAAAGALGDVRRSDSPRVHAYGAAAGTGATLEAVLERLATAGAALAVAIEPFRGEEWNRPATDGGCGAVTALDIARQGVHAGIHHLRAAERAIARARAG